MDAKALSVVPTFPNRLPVVSLELGHMTMPAKAKGSGIVTGGVAGHDSLPKNGLTAATNKIGVRVARKPAFLPP